MRAEKNPFWHTKILGPVLSHISISTAYKPMMDLMCRDASCISLLAGTHGENKFLHPCDAPPSAWMKQWPKLVLWNPFLPPVQRSYGSPLLGLGRIILIQAVLYIFSLIHLHQTFSDMPTCIEQVTT